MFAGAYAAQQPAGNQQDNAHTLKYFLSDSCSFYTNAATRVAALTPANLQGNTILAPDATWDQVSPLQTVANNILHASTTARMNTLPRATPHYILGTCIRPLQHRQRISTADIAELTTEFFHHLSNQKIGQGESADFVGELEHFLDQWSNGLLPYGLWASHVAEWVRESKFPSRSSMILIMKYEDMRLDLEGCISKVATFLGKPLSAEFASELAAKLDFSSMKAEVEMYQPLSVRWREGFSFVRAGASGTVFEPKAEAIFQRAITTESIEDRLSIEELGLI